MRIVVREAKSGFEICEVDSILDGFELIEQFETEDKERGLFEPDFYDCIVSTEETTYTVKFERG